MTGFGIPLPHPLCPGPTQLEERQSGKEAILSSLRPADEADLGSTTNEVRGDICASNVLAPFVLRLSLKGSRMSAWGKRIRECG